MLVFAGAFRALAGSILGLAIAGLPVSGSAALYEYSASGAIDFISNRNLLPHPFSVGQAYTATFVFDDSVADTDASPAVGRYPLSLVSYTIDVGGVYTSSHASPSGLVILGNDGSSDAFFVLTDAGDAVSGIPFQDTVFILSGPAGSVFSSDAFPTSLALESFAGGGIWQLQWSNGSQDPLAVSGPLTSFTPVPEPSTGLLVAAGLVALASRARRRSLRSAGGLRGASGLVTVLAIAGLPASGNAALYEYAVTGTIEGIYNPGASHPFSIGQAYTATFVLDDSIADGEPLTAYGSYPLALASFTLDIGGVYSASRGSPSGGVLIENLGASSALYAIGAEPSASLANVLLAALISTDADLFPSDAIPTSLSFASFDANRSWSATLQSGVEVSGPLTSLMPVPEPNTSLLVAAGLVALAARARRAIAPDRRA
jgi:hypothetical protein